VLKYKLFLRAETNYLSTKRIVLKYKHYKFKGRKSEHNATHIERIRDTLFNQTLSVFAFFPLWMIPFRNRNRRG
jgi:hypothetical protein